MDYTSSPAGLLLNRLTAEDVMRMLADASIDKTDVGNEGRPAKMYLIRQNDVGFAVKFTDQNDAESHVLNTELFEFFKMPFVPCAAFAIGFDMFASFQKLPHRGYSHLTHAVVMPIVPGNDFQQLADKNPGILQQDATHRLFGHILEQTVPVCITNHWDCNYRNVMVETDTGTADRANINPPLFTFVDAAEALLKKTKHGHSLSRDVAHSLATMQTQYMYALGRFNPGAESSIYRKAAHDCDMWRETIRSATRITSYDKQAQLKDSLLARTDTLQNRLKNIIS